MTTQTTLSKRGFDLASGPQMRDLLKAILHNPYHPDTNRGGFVNIGTAENYVMIEDVKKFVCKNVDLNKLDFTYGEGPWGTLHLRTAMAKHMTKTFPSVENIDPEDIIFSNGVTALCEMLGFTIFDEGDGILLPSPIYQAFPIDFGVRAKAKVISVRFHGDDQFVPSSVKHWEDALLSAETSGTKIRALMLCNPHNPLGKCYPKETIIALMKLCAKHKVHLLCDEIYAGSVYEVPDKSAIPFTSALSFDHSPYISSDYVHVIYGMSKDFAAGGIRLGCLHVRNRQLRNRQLMHALGVISQFHWAGDPSMEIAATMLEDEEWLEGFSKKSRERLSEMSMLTRKLLGELGVEYAPGANAGFFLWVDLRPFLPSVEDSAAWQEEDLKGNEVGLKHEESKWQREKMLVEMLMKNEVFMTNGQGLGAEEPGFFRIIFTQDERTLREGLRRVGEVIGRKLKD